MVDAGSSRDVTIAAGAIILMVMAPFLARARYGVPFFAGMTIVIAGLTLRPSPFSYAFNLIPGWENLHNHNVPITLSTIMVGPRDSGRSSARPPLGSSRGASESRFWFLFRSSRCFPASYGLLNAISISRRHRWWRPVWLRSSSISLLTIRGRDNSDGLDASIGCCRSRSCSSCTCSPMGLELVDGVIGRSFFIKEWNYSLQPKPDEATAADTYVHTTGPGDAGKIPARPATTWGVFPLCGL